MVKIASPTTGYRTCDGHLRAIAPWQPVFGTGVLAGSLAKTEIERPMGARGTVLVVDDDRLILASVAAALEGAGFRVWTTDSGEEAVRLAVRLHPDVVVTDLRMPGMDGIALLDRLADDPHPAPRTAIIYSATPPSADDPARLRGAQWIPKASGHAALIDALSECGHDLKSHQ